MDETPYKPPQTIEGGKQRRFQTKSTALAVAAALASMLAGAVMVLVLAALMGALNGDGEYWLAYGAILGLIRFAFFSRRSK